MTSLPGVYDITLYRGDAFSVSFTFEQGGPLEPMHLPLTGWLCQLRTTPDSDTVLATFEVDATSADDGLVTISLDGDQTSDLGLGRPQVGYYDLQATTLSQTFVRGQVRLILDVSRA